TLYKLHGKAERVDEYVSKGGHDYRPDLRIAAFQWINKHIKNDAGEVKDSAEYTLFKPEELRVFPEDKDLPADALNHKIDETFVKRAEVKLPEAGKFDAWKQGLMNELRAKSFRAFPERIPASKETPAAAGGADLLLRTTEPGIQARITQTHIQFDPKPNAKWVLIDLEPQPKGLPEWSRSIVRDNDDYAILAPRGIGPTEWTRKSPPNYVERSHALLGRTVDQGRVWDIAAVLRTFDSQNDGAPALKVIGRGEAGILAAYAALFEPSIKEIVIVDPPNSHKDGPTFLNVLRVLDIPEALGMLAPRKLTLVNAKDKAFDRTEQIYKLAGAAGKLLRK
ncbi:MAG: hypothetical protein JNM56_24570, partial [Planctomycetia bacterium]|nr:hypothetical protein [Planctomycetia bacterium]